jgi:hypothetical protein
MDGDAEVAAWLNRLGLEHYEPAFRDNGIDWQILRTLTAEDLKDLGVPLVRHRRKLLDAVVAPNADTPVAVTTASRVAPNRVSHRTGSTLSALHE